MTAHDEARPTVEVEGNAAWVPDCSSFHACSLCGMRFRSQADFDSHRHHELGPWHGAYVGPIPKENNDV